MGNPHRAGWGLYKSVPHVCTPAQRTGLNTLDAGRRVGVGQCNNKITTQKSKSLDSCSFDSAQDKFRRNDNVAVAATAKQKPPSEIRATIQFIIDYLLLGLRDENLELRIGKKRKFSIPRACTPGQRTGLNTLDAGRRVGVGQGDREFRIEMIGKKKEKP